MGSGPKNPPIGLPSSGSAGPHRGVWSTRSGCGKRGRPSVPGGSFMGVGSACGYSSRATVDSSVRFSSRSSSGRVTRSSVSTPGGTTGATSAPRSPGTSNAPSTSATPIRRTSRGSTRSCTWPPSPTTRSGTSTRRDLLGQRRGGDPHGAGGQARRRAAVPVLVLLLALRCRGRRPGDRDGAVQPSDALRREQGPAPRRASPPSPTTTSARPTCATPPPTARRRGCAPTSWSTTSPATAVHPR